MDLISVIVPVYKVEKYLDRCVQSIAAQTYQNLEIILVDDGSPDNCGAMCDGWAEKDGRIRVIHKENGGLSDARNAGLSVASGDWIGFVDSDDWIAPNFYQVLMDAAAANDCDLAECKYILTCGQVPEPAPVPPPALYETREAMAAHLNKSAFHSVVWNKLYRRSVVTVDFEYGKCHEDEFWTYQILANCKRLAHIPVYLYYYFQRSDSIIGQQYSLKRTHVVEAKARRIAFIREHFPELESGNAIDVIFTCLYHGQMALLHLSPQERKTVFCILRQAIAQARISGKPLPSVKLSHRLWLALAGKNLILTCRIRNLLGIGK